MIPHSHHMPSTSESHGYDPNRGADDTLTRMRYLDPPTNSAASPNPGSAEAYLSERKTSAPQYEGAPDKEKIEAAHFIDRLVPTVAGVGIFGKFPGRYTDVRAVHPDLHEIATFNQGGGHDYAAKASSKVGGEFTQFVTATTERLGGRIGNALRRLEAEMGAQSPAFYISSEVPQYSDAGLVAFCYHSRQGDMDGRHEGYVSAIAILPAANAAALTQVIQTYPELAERFRLQIANGLLSTDRTKPVQRGDAVIPPSLGIERNQSDQLRIVADLPHEYHSGSYAALKDRPPLRTILEEAPSVTVPS